MFLKSVIEWWRAKQDAAVYKRATQRFVEIAESMVRSDGKRDSNLELSQKEADAVQRHRDRYEG